jgi:hypothetical protein
MMHPKLLILTPLLSLLVAPGCSAAKRTGPKVVPVSGRVLYNGQPLEGAHVTFSNSANNTSGYGTTDADGRFTLTTFAPKDGVVPGRQQISVSKVQRSKQTGPAVDRTKAVIVPATAGPRWLIPKHYGSLTTSGLTTEVGEDGAKEIVLELTGTPRQ